MNAGAHALWWHDNLWKHRLTSCSLYFSPPFIPGRWLGRWLAEPEAVSGYFCFLSSVKGWVCRRGGTRSSTGRSERSRKSFSLEREELEFAGSVMPLTRRSGKTTIAQRAPGFQGPCGVKRENNRKNRVAWRLDILVEIAKFRQYLLCLSFPGTQVNSISLPATFHLSGAKWLRLADGMWAEVAYTTFRPGP